MSTSRILKFGRGLVAMALPAYLCIYGGEAPAQTILLPDLAAARDVAARDELQIRMPAAQPVAERHGLAARWERHPSLAWNELALRGIEKFRFNPLRAARLLAHLHAALHDAWSQCADTPSPDRCARIAQHVAAGRTLELFLPEETPGRFMALATSALASLSLHTADDDDGVALEHGKTAAWGAAMRAFLDGSDRTLLAPARPVPKPGTWRPAPPLFALNPVEQGATRWKTWFLTRGDEVRPPPPPAYGSPGFVAEVKEVLEVGRALTSAQKKIANDWDLDIGTATPPGVWNRYAMKLVLDNGLGIGESTALLAEVNLAMFDALVACWTAKMTWWTERPVTEVRERFDPSFTPYVATPSFPGYVSGHASTSGAAAYVLGARIPSVRSEAMAMASEAAQSRLYAGIHLRSDNEEGLKLGIEVGRLAVERLALAAKPQLSR